jgi:Na+/proline symporter
MKRVAWIDVLAVTVIVAIVIVVVILMVTQPNSSSPPSTAVNRPPTSCAVTQPSRVAAICFDGTPWWGRVRSGACSHHGGVREWQTP